MSFARNYAIICDGCGLFCRPVDEETPFGCLDPENPEPYDPYHYCKRCAPKNYRKWLKGFLTGNRGGYWQKSKAEIRAAKKCGLVWVHGGLGNPNIRGDYANYEYVTPNEYARLKRIDEGGE